MLWNVKKHEITPLIDLKTSQNLGRILEKIHPYFKNKVKTMFQLFKQI